MFKTNGDTKKFDSVDEFVDYLQRGGEIEFFYRNKKYSITHPNGELCFIEQENNTSIQYFNDIQELLNFTMDDNIMKNIITEIQPFFRCF